MLYLIRIIKYNIKMLMFGVTIVVYLNILQNESNKNQPEFSVATAVHFYRILNDTGHFLFFSIRYL